MLQLVFRANRTSRRWHTIVMPSTEIFHLMTQYTYGISRVVLSGCPEQYYGPKAHLCLQFNCKMVAQCIGTETKFVFALMGHLQSLQKKKTTHYQTLLSFPMPIHLLLPPFPDVPFTFADLPQGSHMAQHLTKGGGNVVYLLC